jgi:hypothetical protein
VARTLILRRDRHPLRALTAALLLPALVACESDAPPGQAAAAAGPPNSAATTWLPEDLDGEWRGWSFPTGFQGLPVQLTLGFQSLGPDPHDLVLTRYTFPAPGGWNTVNYLEEVDEYVLRFEPDGRLQLDTEMVYLDPYGNLVEERIWKDLQMAPDGETLAGREEILLTSWSGGLQSQLFLSYWLTLERLE